MRLRSAWSFYGIVLDQEADPDLQDNVKASEKAPFSPREAGAYFQRGPLLTRGTADGPRME